MGINEPVTSFATRVRGLSGYAVVVVGTAGARAASFAATVLIARSLGPSGFGDITLFFAVLIPFSSATDFIDIVYVRHVNTSRREHAGDYLRAAVGLKLAFIALLTALAYPIATALGVFVFEDRELIPMLTAGVVSGVFIGFISLTASTFLAVQRYLAFGVVNSLYYLGALAALTVVLWASGLSTTSVYLVFLATSLTVGLGSAARLIRIAHPVRPPRWAVRSTLSFAKWLVAAQILYVAFQRADVMLLSRDVEIEDVGQYGAALRVTVIASLLIGAMSAFLLPRASRTRGSLPRFREYLIETMYLSGGLCASVAVVWLAAPAIIGLFFGDEFQPAVHLARILLLGVACLAIATPLAQLFFSEDSPRNVAYSLLAKYVVLAAGTVVLAPHLGPSGAAWAFVGSEAVGLVYAGVIVKRRWAMLVRSADTQRTPHPT